MFQYQFLCDFEQILNSSKFVFLYTLKLSKMNGCFIDEDMNILHINTSVFI